MSTISAGTTVGTALVFSGDTTGALTLQVSGTVTAATISAAGNVGIGTESPTANLEVGGSSNRTLRVGTTSNAYAYLNLNTWALDRAQLRAEAVNPSAGSGTGAGKLTIWTASAGSLVERMAIDGTGELLVGTTTSLSTGTHSFVNTTSGVSPLSLRHASSTAGRYWWVGPDSASSFLVYNNNSAGVYIAYGGTSWTGTSDERFKTDLKPIENAVQKVLTLRAVTGRFKTDEESVSRAFLIAQDVQSVLPEAVDASNPDKLGLAYTDTIPLLIAAIKEQQEQIRALQDKIAALESK